MNRWQLIGKMFSSLNDKKYLGDFTVLKLAVSGQTEERNNYTDVALGLLEMNFQELQIENFLNLPPNTFGFHYYQFLKRNRLTPFNFSKQFLDLVRNYPITCRYTRAHDMIHTLLDFETDIAGELGVYAFIFEQHYSQILDKAAKTATVVAPLLKPWALQELRRASQRGIALSKGAKPLISVKFETLFHSDIGDLRRELIPAFYA